ncbi:hypothetical protein DVV81_04725 [Clostridium botulinum]|uniref:hypothetical protein n=1 Tax=Clostridium botulinum TaxID=1491 RepID=UPI0019687165|nr:hypothetical protein [Clostridium botulinum]MBN1070477.1 hypothetical protein [Clostridium botulinum]
MKVLKVGQEITIKEDFEVVCFEGKKKVKKGDKAFVTAGGNANFVTGEARGKIQILSSAEIKGWDTENMAKIICSRLDVWFNLNSILQEHDMDISDVQEQLEDILLDILDF